MSVSSVSTWRFVGVGLGVVALLASVAPTALAQEAELAPIEKPWSNEAELSFISTSGNSGSTTLAVADRFVFNLAYAELRIRGDYFKTTARRDTFTNIGGGVVRESDTTTTSERSTIEAQFRQNLTGQVFWYLLGSWYRNQPAGIDARMLGSGGIGYRLIENSSTVIVGEVGIGVTREELTNGFDNSFADLRAFGSIRQRLSDAAELEIWAEALDSVENSDDLRISAHASLTSKLVGKLAMRVWWDIQYDKLPPVILINVNPDEPAALYALDTSDRTVGASLVLDF